MLFSFIATIFTFLNTGVHKGVSYRCVELSDFKSAIKCPSQYAKFHSEIKGSFQGSTSFSLGHFQKCYRFLILHKNVLVAHVEVNQSNLKEKRWWGTKKYKNNIFYSVVVTDKYKGMGFAHILMDFAINRLKKIHGNGAMLALHLNSEDKSMPISARLYYTMGFVKFVWIMQSVNDFKDKYESYKKHSVDLYKLMKGEVTCETDGGYIGSFCPISNYKRKRITAPKNFYTISTDFMKMMGNRRRATDSSFDDN